MVYCVLHNQLKSPCAIWCVVYYTISWKVRVRVCCGVRSLCVCYGLLMWVCLLVYVSEVVRVGVCVCVFVCVCVCVCVCTNAYVLHV
jgi:hypothetical protein